MFVLDCPPGDVLPPHLDALLGFACPASGAKLSNYLEVASPAHMQQHRIDAMAWPRWQDHVAGSKARTKLA